jgi:hypothetical protein
VVRNGNARGILMDWTTRASLEAHKGPPIPATFDDSWRVQGLLRRIPKGRRSRQLMRGCWSKVSHQKHVRHEHCATRPGGLVKKISDS